MNTDTYVFLHFDQGSISVKYQTNLFALFEFCVPEGTEIIFAIQSNMYHSLPCPGHKCCTDHHSKVDDHVLVVRSSKLSKNVERCSCLFSNLGETIKYHKGSLKNQPSAILWVLNEHVSHPRTPVIDKYLDYYFIAFMQKSKSTEARKFLVRKNEINIFQSRITKELGSFFVYALDRFSDCSSRRKSLRVLCYFNSECNTSLTNQETESGCTIQAKMIHLAKTQNCTQSRFRVFKVPVRSESWNNSNRRCWSAFPWQYFITRLANVRNQTGQAFVNPFCDCTAKFVHEPKNIRSTNFRHMWTLRLVNSKILLVSAWCSATLTHCDLQVPESLPQTSRHL